MLVWCSMTAAGFSSRGLAIAVLAFAALFFGMAASAVLEWEAIGPDGGDQFMVRISPRDPDTLFLTAHSAVHRSRDRGETWTPVHTAAMAQATIHGLAFHPTNADEIAVCSLVDGVWYSVDEGDRWQRRSEGLPLETPSLQIYFPMSSVAFDADGRLFVGMGESLLGDAPPAWVYTSTNRGAGWVAADAGIVPPSTNGLQSTWALLSIDAATQVWAVVYGSGVYTWSNNTWLARHGDLGVSAREQGIFLEHDAQDARHLLLGTERDWVYETRDGGTTWGRLPLPEGLEGVEPLPMAYTVAVDPRNDDILWVDGRAPIGSTELPLYSPSEDQTQGDGKYWSTNGGVTWAEVVQDAFRIAADPGVTTNIAGQVRSARWYVTAGALLGFMKSEDGGETFTTNIVGLKSILVNTVWVHPSAPPGYSNAVFAGAEAGLFLRASPAQPWAFTKSVDWLAYTWSFAADPLDPYAVLYSVGNPAWSFSWVRGVYRARMEDFATIEAPTSQLLGGVGVWHVASGAAQPERIWAGSQNAGLRVSTNAGVDWEHSPGLGGWSVTDIELDTNAEPRFAAVRTSGGDPQAKPPQSWLPLPSELGGVFRNTGGTNWLFVPGCVSAVTDLEWVDGTGTLYAASAQGLYRAVDPWTNLVLASPPLVVYDVLVHPRTPDYLYAATPLAVYRSTNAGDQWHEFTRGLTMKRVYTLTMDPETEMVYAGTGGNSVFQMSPDPDPHPLMRLDVGALDYGRVPVSLMAYRDMDVMLFNDGEADLVITNVVHPAAFPVYRGFQLLSSVLPVTLTPGSWLPLVARFDPTSAGAVVTNILFLGNATNSPAVLTVAGEGYDEKGHLDVNVEPDTASWRYDQPWGGSGLRVGDFTTPGLGWPTGVYTLEWQNVDGYALPSNTPAAADIREGQTARVAGVYIALDSDNDTMVDWQEWIAGTDEHDPTSYLYVAEVEHVLTGEVVTLTWSSVSNRLYAIEKATNEPADFYPLETNLVATPPLNIHTDAAALPQSFYRIRVDLAP